MYTKSLAPISEARLYYILSSRKVGEFFSLHSSFFTFCLILKPKDSLLGKASS